MARKAGGRARGVERAGGSRGLRVRALVPVVAGMALGVGGCGAGHGVDTGEFGDVEIRAPVGEARGFAFVFSGERGLEGEERSAAKALTDAGWAVALVDARETLARFPAPGGECIALAGPLEWISRNAQNQLRFPSYREPVLLGRGAGAALAHAALVEAPPLSFAGGLGIDPSPIAQLESRLCDLAPDTATRQLRWRVATLGPAARTAQLVELYRGALDEAEAGAASRSDDAPTDLPLVELVPRAPVGVLAVIYSGDGGWRDLDRTIGEWLAGHGIHVVGVDALRYFWSRRTPDETARDLGRILEHYRERWHVQRVALIGYSFGADFLPFAYNRLPEALRGDVELLSLLAPAREADFEVHLEGWLGAPPSDEALPLGPEVARLDPRRVQCVYGEEEADESLCTEPALEAAERIRTPGSHHFDERYEDLAQRIYARLVQRGSRPLGPPAISVAICASTSGAGRPRG